MEGFTYNGVHCSTFGLEYIPNGDDRWFTDPEYDVYSADVDWKDGGYYYSSKLKVRTFTLKCYFEEIDLTTRQRIKYWLKRGTSGMLVFDSMPFVYWNVRPGKIPVGNWYNDLNDSHSGTVTITFNAYEPFGYLTRKSNTEFNRDDGNLDYTHMIDASDMPADPTTSSTSFQIYNPGTEECGLSIEFGGSCSHPVRFFNERNGSECVFGSLPSNNLALSIDGDTGYVRMVLTGENGYAYHDKGVVNLKPDEGSSSEAYTYLGLNGTLYTFQMTNYPVSNDLIGAKITLNGVSNTTFTVSSILQGSNRVYCARTGSGTPPSSGTCKIMTVNNILIQEQVNGAWGTPTTLSLNTISVDYRPRIQ